MLAREGAYPGKSEFSEEPSLYALDKSFDGHQSLTWVNSIIHLTNIIIINAFKFVMNEVQYYVYLPVEIAKSK